MELEKAKELAYEKIKQYNLEGWSFAFDRSKRRFGCCKFEKKTITLSESLTLLNDYDRILNTILHEIAHALVGPRNGHNKVWRRKAVELGCDGKAKYKMHEVKLIDAPILYECPKCKTQIGIFRRTKYDGKHACGECCKKYNYGKYSTDFLLVRVK